MTAVLRLNNAEKGIAIFSYLTFGIVGFVWLIISQLLRKKIRDGLSYHIYQSVFISVLLLCCYYLFGIIFFLLSFIPKFEIFAGAVNYFFTVKIISVLWFQSTIVRLAIRLVHIYIIIGVLVGKNFFLPFITPTIEYYMKQSNNV